MVVSFQSLKRELVMPVIVSANPKQPELDAAVDFDKKLGYIGLSIILYTVFS
jgi:hypothetical protein